MPKTNATTTLDRVPGGNVTIRLAVDADGAALRRLAALDSRPVLVGDRLVAEVAGELWAAHSLTDGGAIADPFRPTADLVALLHQRARHLQAAAGTGDRTGPGPARLTGLLRPRRRTAGG